MLVHHLNCGTMTPLIVGRLVCRVLLCESDGGLVLVDSGFGLADCADHVGGLGGFPEASVHTTAVEFDTADDPPTREAAVRAAGTATVIPAHDPVIFDRLAGV